MTKTTNQATAAQSAEHSMVNDILTRMDNVTDLIESELNVYQNARLSDDLAQSLSSQENQRCLLSVVIPVYNEINTILRVVSRVAALPIEKEMVIVDDCSTDGTIDLLNKLQDVPGVRVIFHEQNQGKGAALRTAFEHATGEIVVIQDADLEYDPREIPGLIEPILRGESEIVYGSRFIGEVQHDKSWIHRFGNGVLTAASNLFSGLKLTDMETCYKAFHREVLQCIEVDQDRFGIEPELTAKLARRGYRFVEVPISYSPRTYAEGKKIGIRDLFKAFYCIGRYGVTD